MTILITAATTFVGIEVVRSLNNIGRMIKVRVLVEDKSKAYEYFKDFHNLSIEYFEGSEKKIEDPASLFKNIERFFLLTPAVPEQPQIEECLMKMLIEKGNNTVKQIVKLSALGASINHGLNDLTKWQADSERLVLCLLEEHPDFAKNVSFTILRPNLFLQNFLLLDRETIRDSNIFYRPISNSEFPVRLTHVDVRDVTDIGACLLTTKNVNEHNWRTYNITGPETLTYEEIAQLMSAVWKKDIKVKFIEEDEFFTHLTKHQSRPITEAWKWTKLFQWYKENDDSANVHGDFNIVTGKNQRTVKQFLQDYSKDFTGEGSSQGCIIE